MEMLDRLVYQIFAGLDNISLFIDNWCNERYKNIGSFFNKKRKRRKTKKSVSNLKKEVEIGANGTQDYIIKKGVNKGKKANVR